MSEFSQLTPKMHAILGRAGGIAGENGHDYIGTEHVLLALLANPDCLATDVLSKYVDVAEVAREVRRIMSTDGYRNPG